MEPIVVTNDVRLWLKWLTTNQSLPKKKGIPFKKERDIPLARKVAAEYMKEKGI